MSWRDQLRAASFRGVAFFVDSDDITGGRRSVIHEHPQTDGVTGEDLGRQGWKISVTGYVLGPDYHLAEADLVEALTARGAGTLILPLGPERKVMVERDGVRISHTTREGGLATFTMNFFEVDEADVRPIMERNTADRLQDAVTDAASAETDWFDEMFDLAALPGYVGDEAFGRIEGMLALVEEKFTQVGMLTNGPAAFRARLESVLGRGVGIFNDPGELLASIRSIFQFDTVMSLVSLLGIGGSGDAGFDEELIPANNVDVPAATFDAGLALAAELPVAYAPTAPLTTPTRQRQADLQQTLTDSMVRTAIVEAAAVVPDMTWDNAPAAVADRDAIVSAIDGVLERAPDALFACLRRLQVAVIEEIDTRAAVLPGLRSYQIEGTRPALVVAHELYGETPAQILDMADDICRRNGVRHPLFVPSGIMLEVLSNG